VSDLAAQPAPPRPDFDPARPTTWTLVELRDAIAGGRMTARGAVDAYLDRIDRLGDRFNCFTEVFVERSRAAADAIDARRAAGETLGPLAGCPVAIKDNLCTDWGRTTCGSAILAEFESPYNGTAVQRLLDADAIILAKTNMDEFAMGSSNENSAFGPVRNPWDESRVPGGSSGGSSAAVAADLCAGAFGSDTGGSIRQPAALAGVVGLKPTYGSVSRWGLVAFASSLDQIGPIARTADDAALLLSVVAGPDPHDSTSHPRSAEVARALREKADRVADPARLRIGIAPDQCFHEDNDDAVRTAIEEAIAFLRDAGAEIVEVDLPSARYGVSVYAVIAPAEASSNLARYDGIRYGRRAAISESETLDDLYAKSRGEGFGAEVKRRIMLGTYALSSGYYDAYYLRAAKVRRLIRREYEAAFVRCDLILGPCTPSPAFPIGAKAADPLQMYLCDVYTVPASLAGITGVSLPAGLTAGSEAEPPLPLAIQFVGPAFSEPDLLALARTWERARPWTHARPAGSAE